MLAALLALIVVVQGKTIAPSIMPPHCVRTIDTHGSAVHDLDISPDGESLLVGYQDGHARMYALTSGEPSVEVTRSETRWFQFERVDFRQETGTAAGWAH